METQEQKSLFQKYKQQLSKEFFEIENNDALTPDEKVNKMIGTTSLICAAVAIQPLPFADIFILTPIQAFMGHKIAKIRGIDLKESGAVNVLKYLGGVVGGGFAAQQTAIGLYKIGLPGLGGIMSIPLVAGLTFGMGKVMDLYFREKAKGKEPTKEELIRAFKSGKSEGKKMNKDDVRNKMEQMNG
ncbi:hypothetical protein [Jeotgalibacillus haloalkalitolerans]|uniref:DUF697 domain-containing protein n=1 Tax=Jeotgalibacillus haloalkalitolerans TaxID=3104292 RepID=A0ABU5KJQ7_9BACL|nr:hypothetical protein [Jeotgalibacillus sp. HH7-29]MDZ5711374.1 hypothetical protein [Jeotgalibacillus sp. HH7-29]